MKKKLVSLLLCMGLMTGLIACGEEKGQAVTDYEVTYENGYNGTISFMHFSTEEEAASNGGSEGFRKCIDEWRTANPEITLIEEVLPNEEYKTQVSYYAAADELPDVFLLQGQSASTWVKDGLVLDITEFIKDSEYADIYNMDFLVPFTVNNAYYAFPALSGGTCTVVVYDKKLWAEAGFEAFPQTWADVESTQSFFSKKGISTIAFGNSGMWQMNSDFVSTFAYQYTGPEWFAKIMDGTGDFVDEDFVASLMKTQYLFRESGIFNKNFNEISNEEARELFANGEAASFIGGNWDVSYLFSALSDEQKENIGFAVLPKADDAQNYRHYQNNGLGYGVAINSKVASDPEKLEACVKLAKYLTGPAYADYVGEKYALGGFCGGDIDLSSFDELTKEFYEYSYVANDSCEIFDSYVDEKVWNVFNEGLFDMTNGELDPGSVAILTQEEYSNYLLGK